MDSQEKKFCKYCKQRNNKTGFCYKIGGYVPRKAEKECYEERNKK